MLIFEVFVKKLLFPCVLQNLLDLSILVFGLLALTHFSGRSKLKYKFE